MSESTLWTYVRDKLLPPGIHATRIENGVSAGFPDVHYTVRHENNHVSTGSIELKFLRKKNPPFGDDGLNQDQILWIRDELEVGGKVWIVAEVDRHICLIRGLYFKEFNKWTRDDFMQKSTVIIEKGKPNKTRIAEFRIFL